MKKTVSILLVLTMLLALVLTGCGSEPASPESANCQHSYEEQTTPAGYMKEGEVKTVCTKCGQVSKTETIPAIKKIRILALGNSFSVDTMAYLWNILHEAGFEEIVLGNLVISGCSLDTHYGNLAMNSPKYIYAKNTAGSWVNKENATLEDALLEEPWDVVTLQQSSPDSGNPMTYNALQRLVDGLREKMTNPDCKLLWHMTWADQQDSTYWGFDAYDRDQMKMYEAIVSTVQSEVLTKPEFDGVIPVGTAIQNLRTSPVGDNVTQDGHHLNGTPGRYTAALCWYAYITGLPVADAELLKVVAGENLDYIRQAVAAAVEKPYEVTPYQ